MRGIARKKYGAKNAVSFCATYQFPFFVLNTALIPPNMDHSSPTYKNIPQFRNLNTFRNCTTGRGMGFLKCPHLRDLGRRFCRVMKSLFPYLAKAVPRRKKKIPRLAKAAPGRKQKIHGAMKAVTKRKKKIALRCRHIRMFHADWGFLGRRG